MSVYHIRSMRFGPLICLLALTSISAQVIDFESNGLHYKTLTKSGVTVMFAYLPAHLKEYSIVQVSISNGSPVAWMVKAEDFSYKRQDGTVSQAAPALAVVNSLLAGQTLVGRDNNKVYGLPHDRLLQIMHRYGR